MKETKQNGIFITRFKCEGCGNNTTWMTSMSQLGKKELCSSCIKPKNVKKEMVKEIFEWLSFKDE